MDRYGHLFLDEMDRLADGLDATYRATHTVPRPQGEASGVVLMAAGT